MTLLGLFLQPKTNLKTPIIDKIVSIGHERIHPGLFLYGLALGLLTGIAITFWSYLFYPYLPESIKSLNENIKLSVLTRIFYGGITEEILLRYGFMTLLVWLFLKVKASDISYWTAIILSSLIFGVGHLPIVYSTVESVDSLLILYIIFGNTIGGIAYGWLYWKKGLESAMVAHIMTHLTMITIQ
jgi:membrane protease YdiL (CAAX protease family)